MGRTLDRRDAAEVLGVTTREFRQLIRNPTFPRAVFGRPPDEEWDAEDIEAFTPKLDKAAAKGWKVPDALYPWDFDAPPSVDERAANWEVRRRKLFKAKRAVAIQKDKIATERRRKAWIRRYKNA